MIVTKTMFMVMLLQEFTEFIEFMQNTTKQRLDLRLYFFSETVVNLWNNLHDQTVTDTSLNSFKNNLSRLRRQLMGLFMDNFVR